MIAALGRKRGALMQRDRDLLEEQIILEKAKVIPQAPRTEVDPKTIARELLNGFAPPEPAGKPGERLFAILRQRAGIEIALDALQQNELQNRALAVGEVMQRQGANWRELVRRRALAVLELRRANAACAEFRKSVAAIAAGPPGLVCDRSGGPLFGEPIVGDVAYVFFQDCVRAGIIGREDLDG